MSQRWGKGIGGVTVVVGGLVLGTVEPAMAASCTAEPLAAPGVVQVHVTAADPTGRYVYGGGTAADGTPKVILWDNGQPREVSVPLQNVRVKDVNSAGVAVGEGTDDDGAAVAFAVSGSAFRVLPTLQDATAAHAEAVNENGDIAGSVTVAPFNRFIPVVWPADEPTVVRELDNTDDAAAYGIDDDGTVVGRTGVDLSTARVWGPDGVAEDLPSPSTGIGFEASDVRNGWAVGDGVGDGREVISVRWNIPDGTSEVLPSEVRKVVAVNASGVVAGHRFVDNRRAVLVQGKKLVVLPELAAGQLTEAAAITDDPAVVFGSARDAAGVWTAVAWRGC